MKKLSVLVTGTVFLALYIYYIIFMVKMYNITEETIDSNYEILDNHIQETVSVYENMKQETINLAKEKAREEIQKQQELEVARQKEKEQVTVSRNDYNPVAYESYFEVTFYTAGYESTGKNKGDKAYGITASGTTVQENKTAACPKSMEFGTKLYIEGLGYRVCEDRGGAIKDFRLDIYVESLEEALQLGRQTLLVKVLK